MCEVKNNPHKYDLVDHSLKEQLMMAATATPPPARVVIPNGAFNLPAVSIEPNFGNMDSVHHGVHQLDLSACGKPTSAGRFSLIDTWETGFIGKIEVEVSMMAKGWSIAVSFPDPIAIGNVQVFNARYTEISEDSSNGL